MLHPDSTVSAVLSERLDGVQILHGDMRDSDSLRVVVAASDPDEVYNLAGISSVARSWKEPALTTDVNGTGVLRLLQVVMEHADRTNAHPGSCRRAARRCSARRRCRHRTLR